MNTLLKVLGWTLRASALICITYIFVSVARGTNGLTTVQAIVGSVLYHAAFAMGGVQLVGCAKRREAAASAAPEAAVEA